MIVDCTTDRAVRVGFRIGLTQSCEPNKWLWAGSGAVCLPGREISDLGKVVGRLAERGNQPGERLIG
jgi:hypothetical protein